MKSRKLIPYAGKAPMSRGQDRTDGLDVKVRKRLTQMIDYDFPTEKIMKRLNLPREIVIAYQERFDG